MRRGSNRKKQELLFARQGSWSHATIAGPPCDITAEELVFRPSRLLRIIDGYQQVLPSPWEHHRLEKAKVKD
ncbi:hypothetical protein RUM43_012200 [Polyplax serrata]|uniref:Uncharacterized protein n=1 Tax=Polyplax serrata TaxID=468196 RepID=A0AAN8P3B4_POLSC